MRNVYLQMGTVCALFLVRAPVAPPAAAAPACPEGNLASVKIVAVLETPRGIIRPEGVFTGIHVGDGSYILCPAYLAVANISGPFSKSTFSHTHFYYLRGGTYHKADVVYLDGELCLLRAEPPAPGVSELPWRGMECADGDVLLTRYGPAPGVACVRVLRDASGGTKNRLLLPRTPYTHDWLGALVSSTDGSRVYGLLTGYASTGNAGPIYNFCLNDVSMPLLPDAVVTLLSDEELSYLVRHAEALEFSQFKWMGMRCLLTTIPLEARQGTGLRVESVKKHSLADVMGIAPQDIIVKVNHEPLAIENERFPLMGRAGSGVLSLDVSGGGRTRELAIPVPSRASRQVREIDTLGLSVEMAYISTPDRTGFRVVDLRSEAMDAAGCLRLGDIVLSVEGRTCGSVEEFEGHVRGLHGKYTISYLRNDETMNGYGRLP